MKFLIDHGPKLRERKSGPIRVLVRHSQQRDVMLGIRPDHVGRVLCNALFFPIRKQADSDSGALPIQFDITDHVTGRQYAGVGQGIT